MPSATFAAPNIGFEQLVNMSIEELTNVIVSSASGHDEPLKKAPAAMVVISAAEIEQRGYDSMEDVLVDLPGFDVIVSNGANYLSSYQRGYRTPFMQRTLFMIDGIVDNNLWLHIADLSRQYALSNIERIEVVYGPASVVYGPNAFSGVINLITKKSQNLNNNTHLFKASIQKGSFNADTIEASAQGKFTDIHYSLSVRHFSSEEPHLDDLNKQWGFANESLLNNETTWGPLLNNDELGQYKDPSDNWSLTSKIHYKDFSFAYMKWQATEGYGINHPLDIVQPNVKWNKNASHAYIKHSTSGFIDKQLSINTELSYREDANWGGFAEATPDWAEGKSQYSYVSYSNWNQNNQSWQLKQNYDYHYSERLTLSGGFLFNKKWLSKAYDACGYWEPEAYCSSIEEPDVSLSSSGFGTGVVHSSAETLPESAHVSAQMPRSNMEKTYDKGVFIQGNVQQNNSTINAGIRYDHNSYYGSTINPRLAYIYQYNDNTTFKLIYGTAYQEPAFALVFGGWNGRRANTELQPEKVKNLEFITLFNNNDWYHDISIFHAQYSNVIKESASNGADRNIMGLEYKAKTEFSKLFEHASPISGYLNYSYTKAMSDESFNHQKGEWQTQRSEIGDIAPHKLNIGFNIPINQYAAFNTRANYVSERTLYSRNPLRAQNEKLESYFTVNTHLKLNYQKLNFSLSILNLFDEAYYHPGTGAADSGNDFEQRAQGFQNSLLPQVGRHYRVKLTYAY